MWKDGSTKRWKLLSATKEELNCMGMRGKKRRILTMVTEGKA